ncbi:glycosyltransferase [Sphingomonas solaris]|uniref:Glycosyltransferase n=1 Tax=Alterirhizorhabdus solaris TaxID=2529389 RepID=A0A558R2J7_9SPHN|nr:glycosyltransferase [Sphingomonas solaris]TVV73596.1 glycosyltransferase [Sphingomonas solaris]
MASRHAGRAVCPAAAPAGRPRIVFVMNSILTGGAERALGTMLRTANGRLNQYEIHLVLLDREPDRRKMPQVDQRHCLDAGGSLWRSAARLDRLLKRLKPDLVVSLLVRSNYACALVGPRHAKATVLCERMHLGSHLAGRYRGMKLAALRLMPRLFYRRATRVLGVSEGVRRDLVDHFGVPETLTGTIPNGYYLDEIVAAGAQAPAIPLPPDYIVAVGRLVRAKGFSLLIEAYHRADPPVPLLILGEGTERAALQADIDRRGLGARIRLLGFLEDPFTIVSRAQFLVSASHNEGFPNAIAEAMVLGRPVLASDCPSGPAELLGGRSGGPGIVIEAPNGLIVPDHDVDALSAGLRRLTGDAALRDRLGAAARRRMQDFSVGSVTSRYWDIFDRLIGLSPADACDQPPRPAKRSRR